MGIKKIYNIIWNFFLDLNDKQREQVSKLFDKLAIGAMLPIAFRFMSDGKVGDGFAIFIWLSCAIIFAVLSVAALVAKDEK